MTGNRVFITAMLGASLLLSAVIVALAAQPLAV
jgi:hypothetical protein